MRPDYALSLSFDGIALLARAPEGWRLVDEVPVSSPDLKTALAGLHATATAEDPDGARVKLILPNAQIKFLDLPDAGARGAAMQDRINRALEAETPYQAHELVCDWAIVGDRIQVAAVARETLTEAEMFTSAHGFSPVCFVAYAPEEFDGEVFFGAARTWDGAMPERDSAPIDLAAVAVPLPETAPEDPDTAPEDPEETPEAEAEAPPVEDTEAEDAPDVEDDAPIPTDDAPEVEDAPDETTSFADTVAAQDADAEEPLADAAFATLRGDAPERDLADDAFDALAEAPARDPEETPEPAEAEGPFESPLIPDDDPVLTAPPAEPESEPEQEPEEEPAKDTAPSLPAFSSRRSNGDPRPPLPPRRDTPVIPARPPLSADTPPAFSSIRARQDDDGLRGSLAQPRPASAEAPPLFKSKPREAAPLVDKDADPFPLKPPTEPRKRSGLFARRAAEPEPEPEAEPPTPEPAAEPEAKPNRRFGILPARKKPKAVKTTALAAQAEPELPPLDEDPEIPPMPSSDEARDKERPIDAAFASAKPEKRRRQSRMVGLIMTLALLLVLAGAAVWASVFLEDGLSRFLPGSLRGTQTADSMASGTPAVSVAEEDRLSLSILDPVEPQPVPARPVLPVDAAVLSETEAETAYVATGIWQRGPLQPALPTAEGLGPVYTTSIDAQIPQPDAVALVTATALRVDRPVEPPVTPLGPEFTFDLDDRGLVRATPEGAIAPERFVVFAGRPEVVPPLRPAEAALLAEAPELLALRAVMANARPRLRPESLSETRERAELSGLSLAELAAFRPRPRPVTQKDIDEENTTATAQAVRTAPRPLGRPRDFDRIVRAARAAAAEEERRQEAVAAAAATRAPATPTISVPSDTPVSVARAATETNAINRRRINVMGIYGTPGERRATVRLANGRYVQVEVGDSLDGGRVAAITQDELRYVRSGRTIVLTPP